MKSDLSVRVAHPRKGFTLLELMIVIGIIAILAAILLKSVSGSTDSARAAKCLANMHDLASACHATALNTDKQWYPLAGSTEYLSMAMNFTTGLKKHVSEAPGWISWASMNAYASSPTTKIGNESWLISTYDKNDDKRLYALTNGTIWKAISGNASSYRCPLHEQCAKKKGVSPAWSYVMNAYFGWWKGGTRRGFASLQKTDRLLLFAELPFNVDNEDQKSYCSFSTSAGRALDPTLQYDGTEKEVIGFNHRNKRKWYAHVCFADGHVEKLDLPAGANATQLRNLTKWLCTATDFTYNGSTYEELTK